jgi:magnesium-transporting ATPase (P-type)
MFIINYLEQLKKFKILQKFDFSSDRKRSSIIVEDEEAKFKILLKVPMKKFCIQET